MRQDVYLYISNDGNSPPTRAAVKPDDAVSVEDFRLAVLQAAPGALNLPPDAAELQRLMLLSVSLASEFVVRWSRPAGAGKGDFYQRLTAITKAWRNAADQVERLEARISERRAGRGMPQLPSWVDPSCTCAVQAVIGLARGVVEVASQTAIDLHVRRHGRPIAKSDKSDDLHFAVEVSAAAHDKELASRLIRWGVLPDPRPLLRQAREELMALGTDNATPGSVRPLSTPPPAPEKSITPGDGPASATSIDRQTFRNLTRSESALFDCLFRDGRYGEDTGRVPFEEAEKAIYGKAGPGKADARRARVKRHRTALSRKLVKQSGGLVFISSKDDHYWITIAPAGTAEVRK